MLQAAPDMAIKWKDLVYIGAQFNQVEKGRPNHQCNPSPGQESSLFSQEWCCHYHFSNCIQPHHQYSLHLFRIESAAILTPAQYLA
jgi:hypothetical protein